MTRRVSHDTREPIRATSGQIIGYVHRSEFIVPRRRGLHWLRIVNGWAIDRLALERAIAVGARVVAILDRDTGVVFRTTVDKLRARGVPVDFGYGSQLALPESEWEVDDRPGVRQLRLF